MANVSNSAATVGFVNLDELYGDEIVTSVNPDLLEDAVAAAKAIEGPSGYGEVQVHLVAAEDGADNPAIALSTSRSRPMAAMVASVMEREENDDDA